MTYELRPVPAATTETLIENARLIDPANGLDGMGCILLRHGKIAQTMVGDTARPDLAPTCETIDANGAVVAPGIVDIGVKVGEPGERHKESFKTAGMAAAAGGVTTMVTRPDTTPAVDTPETLSFAARRAAEVSPVRIAPMAALTKGRDGAEMTEIGFLRDAGAVAFTDGDRVVENTKIFARALTYARSLDAVVMGHVQEPGLSQGAAMTSGKFASLRGLPAVSAMAERMGLERDLALIEMTGARYHVDQITTAAALEPLRRARAKGLDVTAGVSIHHLSLNELDVGNYRTFFKVKPPLRREEDRLAVIEAVADGTIDVICSMHTPQDEESKRLPFEAAASGAVGLETLLPACMRLYHAGQLSLLQLFAALSLNPARRLGLDAGTLAVGAPADLVLFYPDVPFVLDREKLHSKSKNTPFDGQRLQGRVKATWVGGEKVFSA